MVRILKDRVPDCFKTFSRDHLFFEMYDNKGVYGFAAMYFGHPPSCEFHMEIVKERWNHRVLKMLKCVDWPIALKIMRLRGAKYVVASKTGVKEDQKTYMKLLDQFGFSEPVNFTVSYLKIQKVQNGFSHKHNRKHVRPTGASEASPAS